ncbi:hypothetical protein A3J90_02440 [candidate division WOR-1 bacterium RIFOXYC2_FULL_37_10]|uniref:Flagellar motor switch protein FliG n=1 Tax=candidate division WOR-1 bacterium RIFOXYB2_FULL_37_13 TaxID=1802579 RepID=A0A1F4SL03_UNCSA|nr:MAG: hypothetical protein A2246_06500 [candidate division WOR-1 bacterium RIFOXYA2_FULL_37_7]OGC21142.1 MAG: hypothetical protein A2310_03865 [candidate division WOR-1 bacterium RIFOXYB2_FULL_37_13]OGC36251.1 MAG: hypothetical protein A3J90_02440 [candidate division WOR-1 bacterium RIFOXYC2_FULL_37_10]
MTLSGKEKATIFLSMLGAETSSAILRYLPEELADLIASSISHLPTPTPEALGEVFDDFQSYVALPSAEKKINTKEPAENEASKLSFEADEEFAEDEEKDISNLSPKERLFSAASKKLALLLSGERPQIAAFMLSLFPATKKEEVLMEMVVNREIINNLLPNLKQTYLVEELKEKLTSHFVEKLR